MDWIKRFTKSKDRGHQQGLQGHQGHALGMTAEPNSHTLQQPTYIPRIRYEGQFTASNLSPSKPNGTLLDSSLATTTNIPLTSATIYRSELEYLRHSTLPLFVGYWIIPSGCEEIVTGDTFKLSIRHGHWRPMRQVETLQTLTALKATTGLYTTIHRISNLLKFFTPSGSILFWWKTSFNNAWNTQKG